ncbi:Interface between microtubules and kinetochore protein, variant 2 [Trifolium repens]|nr:Interface between microtubules and kinetochore protein, variant 2 [Trifolium repens]
MTEGKILSNNLKCYTFDQLNFATRNFHRNELVGEGESGSVYKGWLWIVEHTAPAKRGTGFFVALKKIYRQRRLWRGRDDKWLTEMYYMEQLHHPNLVKLIGYCLEDHFQQYLVYEFLAKGSLDNHLFKTATSSNFEPLTWKTRMKIALDVAKGLAFLHSDQVKMIVGDFKISKILIDSNYNAKLNYFGRANYLQNEDSIDPDMVCIQQHTHIYTAPEYEQTAQPSKKSDVYSFGVILLEIMSGKRASDYIRSPLEHNLVPWAKSFHINKRKIHQLIDSHIEGQYSPREAMEVANIVIQCLSARPTHRPNIDEVVSQKSWKTLLITKASYLTLKNACLNEEDLLSGLSKKGCCSSMTDSEIFQSNNLKCFTFNELKTATRNFRPSGLVGKSGFGCVYKGWIDENTLAPTKLGTGFVIAVKTLNQENNQGQSEWLTKINYLGQLHHPNLVKLIGYCFEDNNRILVYEFFTKGNLDNHLFRRVSNFEPLSWKIRMKIALDAAKGLAFLHSNEVEMIHGGFKTSKIMIDSNYNAKLSDFGLEKYGSDHTVVIEGAYPEIYAAREFIETGHLSKKSDVYSFGVVLLEIMSGKRGLDLNRPFVEQNLVAWAKPLLVSKHKISRAIDACLEGQYSSEEAMIVGHIVIKCLSRRPDYRPNIDEVVGSLEQVQDSNDTISGVGSS